MGKELTSPLRRGLGTTPQAPQARCKAKITSTLGFHICRTPSSDGLDLQLVPLLKICKTKILLLVCHLLFKEVEHSLVSELTQLTRSPAMPIVLSSPWSFPLNFKVFKVSIINCKRTAGLALSQSANNRKPWLQCSAKTNFHHQTNVGTESTRFWKFSEQVSKSWGYKAQDCSGSTSLHQWLL